MKVKLANFVESVNEEVEVLSTFYYLGQHFSIVNLLGTGYHKKQTNCYTALHTATGRITEECLDDKGVLRGTIEDIKDDLKILLKSRMSKMSNIDGVISFSESISTIPIINSVSVIEELNKIFGYV